MLALTSVALAQETNGTFDLYGPVTATEEWKPNPELLDRIATQGIDDYPEISVGRVSVVVRGPVTETFRMPRNWSDLSPGQKLLSLPIVNLFVPQKMPKPPGGTGRYFAWGESSRSWTDIATGASPGSTLASYPHYHEPRHRLGYFAW
jgi:hypothetical protein